MMDRRGQGGVYRGSKDRVNRKGGARDVVEGPELNLEVLGLLVESAEKGEARVVAGRGNSFLADAITVVTSMEPLVVTRLGRTAME
jgi:hypothetical protein